MLLRKAVKTDYCYVTSLMQYIQQQHVEMCPDIYKEGEYVLNDHEFIQLCQEGKLWVAEVENCVCGVMQLAERIYQQKTHVFRKVLYIESIGVKTSYRGKGVGTSLLDKAVEIAKQGHYHGVELQVNACNEAAQRLYKKYGFQDKSVNMELQFSSFE